MVVGLLLRINGEIQHLGDGCRVGSPLLFIMSVLYYIAGNARPFHALHPVRYSRSNITWVVQLVHIQGWAGGWMERDAATIRE